MLHTEQNTPTGCPGLHHNINNALVSCAYLFDAETALKGKHALPQAQFVLRMTLPEPTFQALNTTGRIEHKRQGLISTKYPQSNQFYHFYYQCMSIGPFDWLFVYDLGQPIIVQALHQWLAQNGVPTWCEQASGTYEHFMTNPCILKKNIVNAVPSEDATIDRLNTLVHTLDTSPEVASFLDSPSTQVMLVSAGKDYQQHLKRYK